VSISLTGEGDSDKRSVHIRKNQLKFATKPSRTRVGHEAQTPQLKWTDIATAEPNEHHSPSRQDGVGASNQNQGYSRYWSTWFLAAQGPHNYFSSDGAHLYEQIMIFLFDIYGFPRSMIWAV